MLKENIIKKFTQVFASTPQEQQNALATELAKMTPASAEADVDWSVGWGYDTDKDEVGVTISLKIVLAKQSEQEMGLIDLLTNVINMGKEAQLLKIEEALDIAIDDIIANRRMIHIPALRLTETIFAIHWRFWGEPSEEAKIFGEQQRKVLKTQKETACL
jgi:hypothetical protein